MRQLLDRLHTRLQDTRREREQIDRLLEQEARQDDRCRQLMTVPGIGVVVATAIVAAVGNGQRFKRARDFAA